VPPASNILIYRLGSLGDTVLCLPCFHLIRKLHPQSRIFLLTNQPVSGKAAPAMSILEKSGLCDEVIHYPVGTRSSEELLKIRSSIQQISPERLYNLTANRGRLKSLRDYLFFRSCGVHKIIGTPWRRDDLTPRADGEMERESQRLAARLASVGKIDLADRRNWDLRLTQNERAEAAKFLPANASPLLAVSMGTKLPVKDWGVTNWESLLERLALELPDTTLVLIGSADEWERCDNLGRDWPGRTVNLAGKISPRLSAAILERCRLFIGHDSGPTHLAVAVGAPTVALFSWLCPAGLWFPGHQSWPAVEVLYPPLPEGGWREDLQVKNAPGEGIQRLLPDFVFQSAMRLWRADLNSPTLSAPMADRNRLPAQNANP
jgi:heptosyltransferase-3